MRIGGSSRVIAKVLNGIFMSCVYGDSADARLALERQNRHWDDVRDLMGDLDAIERT